MNFEFCLSDSFRISEGAAGWWGLVTTHQQPHRSKRTVQLKANKVRAPALHQGFSTWHVGSIFHRSSAIAFLVGGLEHFLFSHVLGIIIPIDFPIFQRGGSTTNQIWMGLDGFGWTNAQMHRRARVFLALIKKLGDDASRCKRQTPIGMAVVPTMTSNIYK